MLICRGSSYCCRESINKDALAFIPASVDKAGKLYADRAFKYKDMKARRLKENKIKLIRLIFIFL